MCGKTCSRRKPCCPKVRDSKSATPKSLGLSTARSFDFRSMPLAGVLPHRLGRQAHPRRPPRPQRPALHRHVKAFRICGPARPVHGAFDAPQILFLGVEDVGEFFVESRPARHNGNGAGANVEADDPWSGRAHRVDAGGGLIPVRSNLMVATNPRRPWNQGSSRAGPLCRTGA
jgi:hypothetical protein